MSTRKRKPTNGRVPGAKFTIKPENEVEDLKKAKAEALKALEEKEKSSKEWFDKELEKNLKK